MVCDTNRTVPVSQDVRVPREACGARWNTSGDLGLNMHVCIREGRA